MNNETKSLLLTIINTFKSTALTIIIIISAIGLFNYTITYLTSNNDNIQVISFAYFGSYVIGMMVVFLIGFGVHGTTYFAEIGLMFSRNRKNINKVIIFSNIFLTIIFGFIGLIFYNQIVERTTINNFVGISLVFLAFYFILNLFNSFGLIGKKLGAFYVAGYALLLGSFLIFSIPVIQKFILFEENVMFIMGFFIMTNVALIIGNSFLINRLEYKQ